MSWLKQWLNVRRLEKARAVLQEHGLTAVRLSVVSGDTYIETVDGQMLKIGAKRKQP